MKLIIGVRLIILIICKINLSMSQLLKSPFIFLPKSTHNTEQTPKVQDDSCGDFSKCTPLDQCPLIKDLLDQSCFSSDRYFQRLNALTCGYSNYEDMVCCPPGGHQEIFQDYSNKEDKKTGSGFSSYTSRENCGETLIKGADYSGMGNHPWVARVGFIHQNTGRIRFACGGSIIHKRVILTAAHCAMASPQGYYLATVAVGEWDADRKVDCNEYFCLPPVQNMPIERVVAHPGYQENIFKDDVAIIVLKNEIKFGVGAQAICLNASPEDLTSKRADLVGWGKLSSQSGISSTQQTMQVPILPKWQCSSVFKDLIRGEEQLCAGGEREDACAGFGGSPLIVEMNYRWVQVGILSFGAENCGSEVAPSVYTNVAHYYAWIKMTMNSVQ